LADGNSKAAIVNAGPTGSLVINDTSNSFGFRFNNVYLLPPHPVSANNSNPNSLWILPVVDARYFWQFATSSVIGTLTQAPAFKTWAALFTAVGSALTGIAGIDDPANLTGAGLPSAYLNPYQWAFSRGTYQSAAVMMDAMLASIGARLVPRPQTIYPGSLNPNTNAPFIISNYQFAQTTLQAGTGQQVGALQVGVLNPPLGDTAATIPSSVTVVFPYFKNGILPTDALSSRFTLTYVPAQVGFGGFLTNPNYTKTIRSTCPADFNSGGLNPDNLIALQNLAQQIAQDFYGWFTFWQDQTYISVTGRLPTGFDDYWEYSMEYIRSAGDYAPRSRVHSLSHNTSVDDLLHWDANLYNWTSPDGLRNYSSRTWEWGKLVVGTLDANISAFGVQTISVTDADVPFPTDATQHLTVTEGTGQTYTSGSTVAAVFDGNKWKIIGNSSTGSANIQLDGSPTTTVTSGNTGTFNIVGGGTVTALVRLGVCFTFNTYVIVNTASGYEVVDPDRIVQGKVNSYKLGPVSDFFNVWGSAAAGSEASLTGLLAYYIREGFVATNKMYRFGVTEQGFELLNPETTSRWGAAAIHVGSGVVSGTTYGINSLNALGSETAGVSLSAYVRGGLVFQTGNFKYQIHLYENGWEVINPTLQVVATANANIAALGTGTVTLVVDGVTTIAGVKAYTAVLAGARCLVQWCVDTIQWEIAEHS
jgi:hypothetical protein